MCIFSGDCDLEWCDGVGLLIILLVLIYLGLIYYHIIKKLFGMFVYNNILMPIHEWWNRLMTYR
jgi:pyrimidine nucleoside transport protein